MCRSSNFEFHRHEEDADQDPLTITGFYVRLCASEPAICPFPDSLTLLLSPPSPAASTTVVVSLRRIQLPSDKDLIVFGAKQQHRVRAAAAPHQVLSFQLYLGEAKLLKGAITRKKNHHHHHHHSYLKLELCQKSEFIPTTSLSISEVELWVSFDGHVAVGDKITIEKPIIPFLSRSNRLKLEDIPEETEFGGDDDDDADDSNQQEIIEEEAAIIHHLEMDLEVLRKALDMGIWALCLGLGFVVSKASLTNFRPPPTFS